MRVMDAAVMLGVAAICGFVGRDQSKSMDQNLVEFEDSFVPLLRQAKDRGLQFRVDQWPAACMFALQHEVLAAQSIPIQGRGREPFST